jgi:hypothetical protein
MFKSITLLLLLFFLSFQTGKGQNSQDDSISLSRAKNYAIQFFLQSMKETSPVYQGREFIPYDKNIKGSPFFLNTEPVEGILEYNGIEYPKILFAYDLVSDKVVLKNFTNEYMMVAASEKIRRFNLGNHSFFRPEPDITFRGLKDTGFYEILYPGKTMVVAKKSKKVQYYQGEDIPYQFTFYSRYFIYDQEVFREVGSQKDLISVYKTKDNEVRKFLRTEKLHFKKNREETLVESAKFYDQLIK